MVHGGGFHHHHSTSSSGGFRHHHTTSSSRGGSSGSSGFFGTTSHQNPPSPLYRNYYYNRSQSNDNYNDHRQHHQCYGSCSTNTNTNHDSHDTTSTRTTLPAGAGAAQQLPPLPLPRRPPKSQSEIDSDRKFCGRFLLFFTAIVVSSIVFLGMSGMNQKWTMNVGESREIFPNHHQPWWLLMPSIELQMVGKSSPITGGGLGSNCCSVSLYAIPNDDCPPLTGPVVTVPQRQQTMTLGYEDYQYDYFFFNQGSTLTVDALQTQGSSRLFLFQGKFALDCLEGRKMGDSCLDKLEQTGGSLLQQSLFVHEGGSNMSFSFTARDSDIYILLYDNASTMTGTLQVEYSLQLTSYLLKGYSPLCTLSHVNEKCSPVSTREAGCMIVVASSPAEQSSSFSSEDDNYDTASVQPTIQIHGSRNGWVLLILLLPFLALFVCSCLSTCELQQNTATSTEYNRYQPLYHPSSEGDTKDTSLPTPTAPSAPLLAEPTTSSPAVMEDDPLIPVAQAHAITASATSSNNLPVIDIPVEQVDATTQNKRAV